MSQIRESSVWSQKRNMAAQKKHQRLSFETVDTTVGDLTAYLTNHVYNEMNNIPGQDDFQHGYLRLLKDFTHQTFALKHTGMTDVTSNLLSNHTHDEHPTLQNEWSFWEWLTHIKSLDTAPSDVPQMLADMLSDLDVEENLPHIVYALCSKFEGKFRGSIDMTGYTAPALPAKGGKKKKAEAAVGGGGGGGGGQEAAQPVAKKGSGKK